MTAELTVPPGAEIRSYLRAEEQRSLADDVLDGLTRPFKELPPKHLYDAHGSALFDAICEQPEYYPTRTETAILLERGGEIAAATQAAELVELGAGSVDTKTRALLDALAAVGTLRRYVPVDVSETTVRASAQEVVAEHPGLAVHGIVGDVERHLDHLPQPTGPRLVAFLGGTVGNFLPGARRRFLRDLAGRLGAHDHLLIGTDLVKDPAVLEAAYNDAAGKTAAFNRNVLTVMNRELGADFDPDNFEHVAFFDRDREWIDLRLRALGRQWVNVPALDLAIDFRAREEMRTEISTKFTRERLEGDLAAAGLRLAHWLTDPGELYAVSVARP
ncbi:MAG TPA: L-histidine N(alpha)-methyltransferase [Solirubrobacteraceae bacterium]|nr:L-histidine N(alpha)-methyltransferase [Solirubrobacteraceae bacterium]